jgi:hypothetical protein
MEGCDKKIEAKKQYALSENFRDPYEIKILGGMI